MDHIDDILSSDLLERYVLGDVSHDEKIKVDLLRVEHRVIREELDRLERSMESMATDNAVEPPPRARECIIKNIGNSAGQNLSKNQPIPTSSTMPWTKMAASLVLGVFGTWMLMQSQLRSAKGAISEQEARLEVLQRDCDRLTQQYAFINHTNTLPMMLKGADEDSQVIVYWNEALRQSMLRVVQLPAIQNDETFQLWADVDGVMLSLGIFDAGLAVLDAVPMRFLDNATSLNITIEPSGGSEHPDVSRLTASVAI